MPPIVRTALTDDDGTGTTGTVLNNSWQTGLYAAIDAAIQTVKTLTDGATVALDASQGSVFRLAAAGDRTILVPTNPTNGQVIRIQHYASGGARTLSLTTGSAGAFRFGDGWVSSLSATSSGKTDYVECVYNGTDSRWDVVNVTKGF